MTCRNRKEKENEVAVHNITIQKRNSDKVMAGAKFNPVN